MHLKSLKEDYFLFDLYKSTQSQLNVIYLEVRKMFGPIHKLFDLLVDLRVPVRLWSWQTIIVLSLAFFSPSYSHDIINEAK